MLNETREPLSVPESAKSIHDKIVCGLRELLALRAPTPMHPAFQERFTTLLTLFHRYQDCVMRAHSRRPSCSVGCSHCCYHWVEDVYSFETERIADYIKHHYPLRIESIVACCKQDERQLIVLDEIIERKIASCAAGAPHEEIDRTDLLLAAYYQLKRPCPLLRNDGACGIYPVRPLTCRIYFSFSDPELCEPGFINESDTPTYLLDMEEEANVLLDSLHDRYKRNDKTGLRASLVDYLE